MDLTELILQDDDIEEAVFSTFFDDSDSSSSSSEDNFILGKRILESKIINFVHPQDYFDEVKNYSDEDFIKNFRMNRRSVLQLIEGYRKSDIYRSLINRVNSRVSRINEEKTILIFLWFAGHHCKSYTDIARQFNISTGALFRIISDVSQYLNSIADEVIKWPNQEQFNLTTTHYLNSIGFPNVKGCIGNISISITKPLDDYVHCWDDEHFRIVLQAVCNQHNKFVDIFVASPGVIETAATFKNSPLCKKLTEIPKQDFILITSNYNYPLTNYLITPYAADDEPLSSKQFHFNEKLIKCCSDLDHTLDLLKRRFKQLYHVKLRDPTRIINFIKACCILHNLADEEDHIYFEDREWIEEDLKSTTEEIEELLLSPEGSFIRDQICDDVYKLRKSADIC